MILWNDTLIPTDFLPEFDEDGNCYCIDCCEEGHCGCPFCDEPCDCS